MKPINQSSIKRICINCCGLIGDVLFRISFIEKVAEIFPQAKITVILDVNRESLIATHPNVNKIILFRRDKASKFSYIKNLFGFIKELRSNHFDIMFNLYGGGSSAFITWCSGAKYRIGFYYKKNQKYAYTHPCPWPKFDRHWSQEFALLLAPFDVKKSDLRAGTTFIPHDNSNIIVDKILADVNQPLVLFNLGSGDPKKIWSIENYFQVAQHILSQYHHHIGVFINPGQEFLSESLVKLFQKNEIHQYKLIQSNDFSVLGNIMQRSRYILTGDTGLMHLAFGVKLPVIGLFTETHPDYAVAHDSPSVICYRESRTEFDKNHKPKCVTDLPVELVIKAIDTIEAEILQCGKFETVFKRIQA